LRTQSGPAPVVCNENKRASTLAPRVLVRRGGSAAQPEA